MRLVIQRVNSGSVAIRGNICAEIKKGLVVLVGFHKDDQNPNLQAAAKKLVEMRIFANEQGRFDRSVQDIDGGIILIPQFTLFAETTKGRRPDFFQAMEPNAAKKFFNKFVEVVKTLCSKTECGQFGADMQVSLINDGPVTIIYDSP